MKVGRGACVWSRWLFILLRSLLESSKKKKSSEIRGVKSLNEFLKNYTIFMDSSVIAQWKDTLEKSHFESRDEGMSFYH